MPLRRSRFCLSAGYGDVEGVCDALFAHVGERAEDHVVLRDGRNVINAFVVGVTLVVGSQQAVRGRGRWLPSAYRVSMAIQQDIVPFRRREDDQRLDKPDLFPSMPQSVDTWGTFDT